MGLSANQINLARGQQVIQRAVRTHQGEPEPSEVASSGLPESSSKTIPGAMNALKQEGNSRLQMPSVLSQALVFRSSSLKQISVEPPLPDPRERALISPLPTSDQKNRAAQTPGLGDRQSSTSNTDPSSEVKKFYPLTGTADVSSYQISSDEDPTQSDALQIRSAISDTAQRFFATTPDGTEADFQTQIDSELGSGTSDLFGVHLEDQGGGSSALVMSQVEFSDLDTNQQDTFRTAAANAYEKFSTPDNTPRSIQGVDVSGALDQMTAFLGFRGQPLIADLKKSLSEPGDTAKALADFKTNAQNLGLTKSEQNAVNNFVSSLSQEDGAALASFNKNPLVDNLKVSYKSGRFAPAYSPSTIATYAALTANTTFLNK